MIRYWPSDQKPALQAGTHNLALGARGHLPTCSYTVFCHKCLEHTPPRLHKSKSYGTAAPNLSPFPLLVQIVPRPPSVA